MKKFEFRQCFVQDLKKYGQEGWNIAAVNPNQNNQFWLSREIEDERKVIEVQLPDTANPEWIKKNADALREYFGQSIILPTGE